MAMLKGNNQSFHEKWPSMQPTVLKLLRQESISRPEWQELFWSVHAVCLWDEKGSGQLQDALKKNIKEFIGQAQLEVKGHHDDESLLRAYIYKWTKFFAQCNYLPLPFMQLEGRCSASVGGTSKQASTMQTKKNTTEDSMVRKMMLKGWNESIFADIKQRLQDSAMKLVLTERSGEAFDSQLVIGVRESYVNLCSDPLDKLLIYRDNFERAYLQATETYYKRYAPEYLAQNGVLSYLKYADLKMKEEDARAQKYLETRVGCASVEMLRSTCVRVLVEPFKEQILAECLPLIRANETQKLRLMFNLMERIKNGTKPMQEDLEKHIFCQGIEDMKASATVITTNSESYVEKLLELFRNYTKLVHDAFNDSPLFMTSRDKAYKRVVNDTSIFCLELPLVGGARGGVSVTGSTSKPESKCPELLANYCDMLLRRTAMSKKLTSDEVEIKLREVLLVLKYVVNKDVFMMHHKAHLTRRLILETSSDSEKEEDMVEWLREVGMPADYVNKLGRMFQDMKVSNDMNNAFKEACRNNNENIADSVNIKILNAGAWSRGGDQIAVTLPPDLEDIMPQVEEFYKNKHSGRKLQWHHHLANGVVTFATNRGRYDLEVTTFQMTVLFAWNGRAHDKISFESLQTATELPEGELRKTLNTMVFNPKFKKQILCVTPGMKNPRDFHNATEFWINHDFAHIKNGREQQRGKITLIQKLQLATEKTKKEDNEGIVQLRILRVQEAIVKILKMRKRITNAALQTELVEILKNMFLPSKKLIKGQIEWLIDNKYMQRDEEDLNAFIYMA